jgi:transposase-like protein
MAMNRVQFQPGLSLPAFLRDYGTEDACFSALLKARWPSGFICPRCECITCSTFMRGEQQLWQCTECRCQTSLTAGTIFEHSRLPLTTWFLALYLLTQTKTNLSALELSRHLGVSYSAAWRMKHKLMEAMTQREASRQLTGLVQIDDAYLGGERNGGKRGRGSENKRPFVIAVATDEAGRPGFAVIEPLSGFTKLAITQWANQRLQPGAEVNSDGLKAFGAVASLGHSHTVIQGASPRQTCEDEGVRWVNVVLSNLKRALDGTYHVFCFFKYAHRYLGEAAWRFNRRFRLEAMVPRLLVAAARCLPWSEARLRDVPVYGS